MSPIGVTYSFRVIFMMTDQTYNALIIRKSTLEQRKVKHFVSGLALKEEARVSSRPQRRRVFGQQLRQMDREEALPWDGRYYIKRWNRVNKLSWHRMQGSWRLTVGGPRHKKGRTS